ncbi:hypothetical protein AHF37_06822 [Paragonimus kellicotti]|nr:hypothetical protein AHF37_06822 [Paragonimus kellicotti]
MVKFSCSPGQSKRPFQELLLGSPPIDSLPLHPGATISTLAVRFLAIGPKVKLPSAKPNRKIVFTRIPSDILPLNETMSQPNSKTSFDQTASSIARRRIRLVEGNEVRQGQLQLWMADRLATCMQPKYRVGLLNLCE